MIETACTVLGSWLLKERVFPFIKKVLIKSNFHLAPYSSSNIYWYLLWDHKFKIFIQALQKKWQLTLSMGNFRPQGNIKMVKTSRGVQPPYNLITLWFWLHGKDRGREIGERRVLLPGDQGSWDPDQRCFFYRIGFFPLPSLILVVIIWRFFFLIHWGN